MKTQTLVNLFQRGQLLMMLRLENSFNHLYRLSYLVSAQKNGFLKTLSDKPVSFDGLAQDFCKEAFSREALKAWLDLGVHLGELKQKKNGYELRGYSKKLARPENDPLIAMIEEVVLLHYDLILNLPGKLKQETKWRLEEQDNEMIARSSRILEPFQTEAIDLFFPASGQVRLLEVGCGSGFYANYAAKKNRDLSAVCVELQPEVAKMAQENFDSWGVTGRIVVEQGDIRDKKPGDLFDIVTLYNNIYYFPDSERVELLGHLKAFLKPGGMLLLTTCCKGGSLVTDILHMWGTATAGCGGLPSIGELKRQIKEAGFEGIQVKKLIPGETFFAIAGFKPPVV